MPYASDGLYEYAASDELIPLHQLLNKGITPANQALRDHTVGIDTLALRVKAAERAVEDADLVDYAARLAAAEQAATTATNAVEDADLGSIGTRIEQLESATSKTEWLPLAQANHSMYIEPLADPNTPMPRICRRGDFVQLEGGFFVEELMPGPVFLIPEEFRPTYRTVISTQYRSATGYPLNVGSPSNLDVVNGAIQGNESAHGGEVIVTGTWLIDQ